MAFALVLKLIADLLMFVGPVALTGIIQYAKIISEKSPPEVSYGSDIIRIVTKRSAYPSLSDAQGALTYTFSCKVCGITFEMLDLFLLHTVAQCNGFHCAVVQYAANQTRNIGTNPFCFR